MLTHLDLRTLTMNIMNHDGIPAIGTEAFKVWWESQYDPAESHNIDKSNIEVVDGSSLELNTIFYELESNCPGDWVGK